MARPGEALSPVAGLMVAPRFFVDRPLRAGEDFALPAGAARHVQVLRLQPGAAVRLFDGRGAEWPASVQRMGRSEVEVQVGEALVDTGCELALSVTLALGIPANERMDAVVEKATELGVAVIQPLICERSVLRLAGERAEKKRAHWQAVAVAACEQSRRTRVPAVQPIASLRDWLQQPGAAAAAGRWVLSLRGATPVADMPVAGRGVMCLSGPEGGLSDAEEDSARRAGFLPVSLGPRVLRADTAPLAVLAWLGLRGQGG